VSITDEQRASGHERVAFDRCDHVPGPFFHGTRFTFEDHPNVTGRRSPDNVTVSYRARVRARIGGRGRT
jgi:hypothetical protein